MEELFKTIKAFEGIVGALLGVIITMLMNEYLKSKGKIKYYYENIDIKYRGRDEYGCYIEIGNEKDYENIEYEFKFQLYNTSESKKILRDIKIKFVSGNSVIETIPKDSNTRRAYAGGFTCDEINIINVNPKEIIEVNIEGYLSKSTEDIKKFKSIDKVYMLAKDSNNRTVKKIIKDYKKTS